MNPQTFTINFVKTQSTKCINYKYGWWMLTCEQA